MDNTITVGDAVELIVEFVFLAVMLTFAAVTLVGEHKRSRAWQKEHEEQMLQLKLDALGRVVESGDQRADLAIKLLRERLERLESQVGKPNR